MRNDDAAMLMVFVVVGLIILAISLTIAIFFNLTLYRCLSRIRPRNRDMEPGLVWLNLIPCFSVIWIFVTIIRISSSLRKEFEDRNWNTASENFGFGVGLGYAICALAGIIPYLGVLASLASLVCFIIYWVQIANYSSRLLTEPAYGDGDGDRYRDDDLPLRRTADDLDSEPDERFRS